MCCVEINPDLIAEIALPGSTDLAAGDPLPTPMLE
jgi:hypothetical protein